MCGPHHTALFWKHTVDSVFPRQSKSRKLKREHQQEKKQTASDSDRRHESARCVHTAVEEGAAHSTDGGEHAHESVPAASSEGKRTSRDRAADHGRPARAIALARAVPATARDPWGQQPIRDVRRVCGAAQVHRDVERRRFRLLPLPNISPWDIIKVLDLVQCHTANARWELVRVRWNSGMESWLPIELVQRNFVNLLQQFYVNTINSWGLRDRIYAHSIREYKTEVELWLYHSEFLKFYQYLRRKRAMAALGGHAHSATRSLTPSPNYQVGYGNNPFNLPPPASQGSMSQYPSTYPPSTYQVREDVKPVVHRLASSGGRSVASPHPQLTPGHAMPRSGMVRAVPVQSPPPPLHARSQHQSVGSGSNDSRYRAVGREIERDLALRSMRSVPEAVPQSVSRQSSEKHTESRISAQSQSSEEQTASRTSVQSHEAQNTSRRQPENQDKATEDDRPSNPLRIRKRLIRFQSTAGNKDEEDEDDDIPLAEPKKPKRPDANGESSNLRSESSDTGSSSKKLKRLRRQQTAEEDSDSDLIFEAQTPAKQRAGKTLSTEGAVSSNLSSEHVSPETASSVDDGETDDDDDDDFDETHVAPPVIGEIRCTCGANSVGTYAGTWLHCWNDECGVWEHAECVGMLYGDNDQGSNYKCSKCDESAYKARLSRAKEKLIDWMFQCCDSKNSIQLHKLVRDFAEEASSSGWKHSKQQHSTVLMKAARYGMVKCVRHLIKVTRVDVFATDSLSLNVLHHAVLGNKPRVVKFLLKTEPKLLDHQDRTGRTPFHCMLQSSELNDICVSLLSERKDLAVAGDLEANLPIHYALRAVTKSTVHICWVILQAEPTMMFEKSSDGMSPFMVICKAAAIASSQLSSTEIADYAKQVIQMMLSIDVLGTFLNERAPNGWTGLHFATAAGNHELVSYLCSLDFCDLDATTSDELETALHIAARGNFSSCVRVLMEKGAKETAKDSKGWIPIVYAETPSCLQEFLHWKLTKQISRLNRMSKKFEQKEIVEQWKKRVVLDPVCFGMINDWCHCDLDRVERMDGIFLRGPFVLRLDNKLDYLNHFVFPAVKSSVKKTNEALEKDGISRRKVIKFAFSESTGCYWRQLVLMGKQLEPEDFRRPMRFTIDRTTDANAGSGEDVSLKVVLIRLAGALSATEPGLLVRQNSSDCERSVQPQNEKDETQKLLEFYLLGELVAHLVLYNVSLSGILDFSSAFLRCSIGREETVLEDDRWALYGRSFAGGFDHVIPSVLELLHPDEFRVLLNGGPALLDASAVNWDSVMDWSSYPSDTPTKSWWPRFMTELVIEEQQLVFLMLAETLQSANQKFFITNDTAAQEDVITVVKYPQQDDDDDIIDEDDALEFDLLTPFMDYKSHTLNLPQYSCYSAFKAAMLKLIRRSNQAFHRR
ncbi:Ankyrin repeat protein, partial [Globisporangium splendens]